MLRMLNWKKIINKKAAMYCIWLADISRKNRNSGRPEKHFGDKKVPMDARYDRLIQRVGDLIHLAKIALGSGDQRLGASKYRRIASRQSCGSGTRRLEVVSLTGTNRFAGGQKFA